MNIRFTKHQATKEVKHGYSWTVFFFGAFCYMLRGQWGMVVLSWIAAMFTLGLSNIVFAFFANKQLANKLLCDGWSSSELPRDWVM